MRIMPATRPGRWSLLLLLAFAAGLAGLFTAIGLGERGGDTFSDNWWLAGPGLIAAVSGVGVFVAGVFALVKGERALTAVGATLVGLLVTFFVSAELLFPH